MTQSQDKLQHCSATSKSSLFPSTGSGNDDQFPSTHSGNGPQVWSVLKWVVSLGLLTWLALQTNWAETLATLQSVSWVVILAGLLCMTLAQALCAWRLQLLLAAQDIPVDYCSSLRLTFVGLFAGNFLPTTVGGDAVKVVALAQRGYSKVVLVACVVADRLTNVVAAVFLLPSVLFVPHLLHLEGVYATVFRVVTIGMGFVAVGGVVYGVKGRLIQRDVACNVPTTSHSQLRRLVNSLLTILDQWIAHPRILVIALCLSWLALFSSITTVWIIALGLGIPIGAMEIVAVVMLTYFVTLLPISFNGLGVTEISFVYLLQELGTLPEQALALALIARIVNVGVSLLGAVDILVWKKNA